VPLPPGSLLKTSGQLLEQAAPLKRIRQRPAGQGHSVQRAAEGSHRGDRRRDQRAKVTTIQPLPEQSIGSDTA